MIPRAAITAVSGIGSTRSAQMRPTPRAHAQLPQFRSDSTALLASSGVGLLVQEATASARTLIMHRAGLRASERAWLALISAFVRQLQPSAHAGLVVAVGLAEPPFQVCLL